MPSLPMHLCKPQENRSFEAAGRGRLRGLENAEDHDERLGRVARSSKGSLPLFGLLEPQTSAAFCRVGYLSNCSCDSGHRGLGSQASTAGPLSLLPVERQQLAILPATPPVVSLGRQVVPCFLRPDPVEFTACRNVQGL